MIARTNPYSPERMSPAQKALYASVPQQWEAMPPGLSRADPTLSALITFGLVDITYVGQQRRRGEASQPHGWNWRKTFWRQIPNAAIAAASSAGVAAVQGATA